jgi:hypothetical protein
MTGQERDDAESSEGAAGGVGPAGEERAPEPTPDQRDTASLEPERPEEGPAQAAAPPAVGPGGTSILPPVPGGPPAPVEQPRWAARAQVPTPRIEDYPDEWVTEPPRRVLFPVLLTVCVMLLLAVLGLGIWLALDDGPGPAPSATTGSSTTAVTTSSTPPTTTTTSATPTGITVPNLVGEEYADAAQTLAGLGLEPERSDVFDPSVPAGLVVATSPTVGTSVAAGQTITVFVSRGPEPTAAPTSTATTTGT